MEAENIKEIKEALDMAQQGSWMPIATIALLFSIIILLLLAFWKKSEKENKERHKDHEETIRSLNELIQVNSRILAKHENELKNGSNRLDRIEDKVNA